jgi:hypothetical protein
VILDTNALMMPVECDVRLFDELDRLGLGGDDADLVVPAPVVAELDRLAGGNGRAGVAASVGRDLADRCRTVETDASFADDAVVELATGSVADRAGADGRDGRREPGDEDDDGDDDGDGDEDAVERLVVTNDRPLRDRLLGRGVRVIGIRGRNKLDVTQP